VNPHDVFVSELGRIERIIAALCHRNGLVGDDAEDFAGWARLRLIEDDYAIIRKFRRQSSIGTFLTAVLSNLYRDFRVRRWGRWRPSSQAHRLGRLGVLLETLIRRDGHTLHEAIQVVRSAGISEPDDLGIARLVARLPNRTGRARSADVSPDTLPSDIRADDRLDAGEAGEARRTARTAVERALSHLPDEDQLILRLRYWENMRIADIARTLNLDQKPLYRRIESDLARLRTELESQGVDQDLVAEVIAARSLG
jgi:RNA polymerase sigma factor for flagellar operon FliA